MHLFAVVLQLLLGGGVTKNKGDLFLKIRASFGGLLHLQLGFSLCENYAYDFYFPFQEELLSPLDSVLPSVSFYNLVPVQMIICVIEIFIGISFQREIVARFCKPFVATFPAVSYFWSFLCISSPKTLTSTL